LRGRFCFVRLGERPFSKQGQLRKIVNDEGGNG